MAVATVVGLAGTTAAEPAGARDGGADDVDWAACPDDVQGAETMECGTVTVPLDYRDPGGRTIEIAISRIASTDPEARRGILMLNPGGPGGSGLRQPADLVDLGMPATALAAYDLIGMDPRGVGHSAPVSCGFTVDQDYRGNLPPYAVDDAAVIEQAEASKAIADQCAENDSEGILPHLTTANAARDMDRIREALGEDTVSYFGLSYGTALGSAYASLFPENGDRMILDSNVGGTALDDDGHRRFALGMEATFPEFAEWAARRHESYGLGRTPEEVRENYFRTAQRLDERPFQGFDGAHFRAAVFGSLYAESLYGPLSQFWQSIELGDADGVRRGAGDLDLAVPASSATASQGTAELSPYDNMWSAFRAYTCNDTDWPENTATYRMRVAWDRYEYPMFGAAAANVNPCAFWRHDSVGPPVEIVDEGPRNILILQNTLDPATPLKGGELAREAFGDRARMVSVEESGHGVYLYDDNPCALNITTRYLVDGQMPDTDVVCEGSASSGLDLDGAEQRRRDEALARLNR